GSYLPLDRVRPLPRPVQSPPPLWLGGATEAAFRRAGRLGDGWLGSLVTPDAFEAGVERILGHAARAGRTIPGDHFGTIISFRLAADAAAGWRAAEPDPPPDPADEATPRAPRAPG